MTEISTVGIVRMTGKPASIVLSRRRAGGARAALVAVVVTLFALLATSAGAVTIGSTAVPSGAEQMPCSIPGAFYAQRATGSAYNYVVPAGGGAVTSWSINTTGDTPGSSITFLVLKPSGGEYTVTGFDTESIPNPLPVSGIATFNLATPITVGAGETIGLYSSGSSLVTCYSHGGTLTSSEILTAGIAPTPSAGAAYTPSVSEGSYLLNLSANIAQSQDVGVAAAAPSSIPRGSSAAYIFTVNNAGPGNGPITFTDAIPGGLSILAAVSSNGSCSVTGQSVSCTISGLAAGASSSVFILVSAPTAGVYANTANVTSTLSDANPSNNSATDTLTVTAPTPPPPPACKTIQLKGSSLSLAKTVLQVANCKVGKIVKQTSKSVRKGLVITTSPGPGKTLANNSVVKIIVSSGPPKKHKRKH